jgi:hypothetical protein
MPVFKQEHKLMSTLTVAEQHALKALCSAFNALQYSKPTAAHYSEPNERHEEAKRLCLRSIRELVRPLVRSWLDANQKNIIPAEGYGILVEKVLQAHPELIELTEISPRIVAIHAKTWLKEEGYLVNG